MNTNKKTLTTCLLSTLAIGLAAHAAGMLGGISFHDDVVCTYDVGATHIFGRFTLGLLGKLTRLPFGGSNYSLPWFNGLLSLLLIAAGAWLIVRALHIENRLLQILTCGILAVFPVVTATFAYWFTAPYYMLAFFMACLCGVWLTKRGPHPILTFLLAVLLGALMIGIYQAYLPVMLSLEVLLLLEREIVSIQQDAAGPLASSASSSADRNPNRSFRESIKESIWFLWLRALVGTAGSLGLYLLLMRLSLSATGKELYAYRGLDTLGAGHFGYLARIGMAYRMFFNPESFLPYRGSDDYLLFMWSMKWGYRLLIAAIVLMSAAVILRMCRKTSLRKTSLARLLILLLVFPAAANFIFVMTDFDVYSLMLYGEVMIFVLAIWLVQAMQTLFSGSSAAPARLLQRFSCAAAALVLYAVLFYVRYDNLCYYKAGRMQEAAVSYGNVLIARIQSLEGYDPSLPVCFLNEFEKDTTGFAADEELSRVSLTPYGGSEIINDYSWVSFLRVHCGFAPDVAEDYGQYDDYVVSQDMPRYPAGGSIRIVDGVIVVRF